MVTNVNTVTGSDGYQASATASASSASANLTSKDAFLKLLVAQIKNQNPLNPADGVQFLTQLTQFSQLEQQIDIRSQLETLVASAQKTETPAANSDKTAAA